VNLADGANPEPSAAVDQIDRGPILVAQRVPVGVVVVEELGKVQSPLADLGLDRGPRALEAQLRRVDADDGEPARRMPTCRFPDPGNRADAVDSAEGPDVQEHDTAAE